MVLMFAVGSAVLAGPPVHAPDSVIYLTKNTNNNQVHYGVKLGDDCQPDASKPVYAYWRMLEKGPGETDKLMFWEQPGYGVKQQRSEPLQFIIRGVPEQQIRLETFSTGSGCGVRAYTDIDGAKAVFQRIDIEVSGWANVHRVEIFGVRDDGTAVSEVTHDDSK